MTGNELGMCREMESWTSEQAKPQHERSGARIVVDSLLKNGVDLAFGFPGGVVIPLYDEFERVRDQLRHILVRHEQGAVHAAQAYARVTGRTGVAIGTSGPGASNLVTGLMDAQLDSTPIVVMGGQVPTNLIGKDAFQECDMMGITNAITKHNFQCRDVNEMEEMIDQAFYIARTGRPGPVYVDLPKDVLTATTLNGRAGPLDLPFYVDVRPVDPRALGRAVMLLKNAKRPLFLLGQGVILAEAAKAVSTLAQSLEIPVTTTIMAKGAFDELHPLSVGCLGMHGRRVANYAVSECDVLVALGCRFSDRITGNPKSFTKGKKIIHVDIDPYEIGKNVPAHVELTCDVRDATEALSVALRGFVPIWRKWTSHIEGLRRVCNRCIPKRTSEYLQPQEVIQALNDVLEGEDVVTTGVGQHQMFASHFLNRREPRTFVTSGGAGTMGFCLPASIGAALAKPDVNVWAVDGDGSLQMTVQELGTMAASGAKVKILILDNGYLGMVRQWQELFFDRRYSAVELSGSPDFVKLAEAYGIEGIRASDLPSLRKALQYAKHAEGSVVIHVPVEPESNIKPMIPPGGSITDFFGGCIERPGRFFSEQELADASPKRGDE